MTTTSIVVSVPGALDWSGDAEIFGEKDAHVAAAADKRLARGVNEASLSLRALSPGEFVNEVLPRHTESGWLRP